MFFLLELGVVLGLGGFVYHDFRNGFTKTKMLVENGVQFGRKVLRLKENLNTQLDRVLEQRERPVHLVRQAIGEAEVSIEDLEKKACDHYELAKIAHESVKDTLRESLATSDQTTRGIKEALAARFAKEQTINEEAAKISQKAAERQRQVLSNLYSQLAMLETKQTMGSAEVSLIKVYAGVRASNEAIYQTYMQVASEAGLMPSGDLKALLSITEHDMRVSGKMVELAQRSNQGSVDLRAYLEDQKITQVLDEARKGLSLPPARENVKPKHEYENNGKGSIITVTPE